MNKSDLISKIEKLYPADSKYNEVAFTGLRLLESVLKKHKITFDMTYDWRSYSEAILKDYLSECEKENVKSEKNLFDFLNRNYG